jgi:hypothetical protein
MCQRSVDTLSSMESDMHQSKGREDRRFQIERLKNNRKGYWGYGFGRGTKYIEPPDPMSPKQLGVVVQTPHPCSCRACGNQRRTGNNGLERLTLQEHRWLQQYKEQISELED